MKILDVRNISYKIKDKTILKDISFAISQGSFTSIIGMNGSGKTTLLKLISNAIQPVSGKIVLFDKEIEKYSVKELAQKISMVFQSSQIDFDFSALQIVMMGRIPYQNLFDRDKQEDFAIAESCMRQTNSWHLKDRLVNSLSGGERQRVFIARSLCQKTPIILLDEPIANLDLKHQIEIMQLLKKIQQQNRTIIIVLHDLSLALKYSDYVLALKDNKMQFFDKAQNVLTAQNITELFEVNAKIIENNNIIIEK